MIEEVFNNLMLEDIQIIPVKPDKTPAVPSWKEYSGNDNVNHDVSKFISDATTHIAMVCGKSSKNLEVIDIDCKYFGDYMGVEEFQDLVENTYPGLLNNLIIQKTVNKGLHLIYRCEKIEGNQKLAKRKTTEEESKINPREKFKVLFETRGEGGYALVAPSNGYEIVNGSFDKIPTLTTEERDVLLLCAKSFNEPEEICLSQKESKNQSEGIDVFSDFNNKVKVWDLLKDQGYSIVSENEKRITIKRDGADSAHSGYIHKDNDVLVMFSSSTEFEPEKGYNSVQVYAQIHHNGDLSNTSKDLFSKGYGVKNVQYEQQMDTLVDNQESIDPRLFEGNEQNGHSENIFPIDVFPVSIIELINEAYDKLNYPIDFMASSILAASSVAIGTSRELQITKGWKASSVLYIMIVGAPGTCKTHPINFALKPIKELDETKYRSFKSELNEFDAKSTKDQKGFKRPQFHQTIVKDSTLEALANKLENNIRGLLYHKDELIALIKDFTRYKASGSEEQFWLSNWNGSDSIVINRATKDDKMIEKPFVSLIGTIQPGVLKTMLAKQETNGFIDRFSIAYPDNLKSMAFNEEEIPQSIIDNYHEFINKMLQIKPLTNSYEFASPKTIKLSKEAKQLWKEWFDELAEKKNNTKSERIQSIYSKLDNMVAKIALILHCMDDTDKGLDRDEITRSTLLDATRVGEYFINNMMKVLKMEKIDKTDKAKAAKEMKALGWKNKEIMEAIGITSRTTLSKYLKL